MKLRIDCTAREACSSTSPSWKKLSLITELARKRSNDDDGVVVPDSQIYRRPKNVKGEPQKSSELKCPARFPLSRFTYNLGRQNFTTSFSNYNICRKRNRKSRIKSRKLWDMKPTHSFLQVTNNLLPNYNVAQIRARICVTRTQKFEVGAWIESHCNIRALLFNRTFRSRARQLVSPVTGPQLPKNRHTSGQKVHRFRRPLVKPCRNQFRNPTLTRFGKEIAKMGGREGEILKSTDTAMLEKVEEARRLRQQLLWSLLPRKALSPTSLICEDLVHHLFLQVSLPDES